MSIALFLGFIGGLYPAWQASKLVPLEAMRYHGGGHQRNGRFNLKFGGMTFRNVFRRRTRTLLTLTAIGIGIGAVVAMGGIVAGFTDQITEMLGSSNAHLVALEADVSDFGYSAIDERVGARLAAHPDIARVSGVVMGVLTNVGDAPFFILFGYHPQEAAIAHFKLVDGSPLSANRQALVGIKAAEMLGSAVGDTVRLGDSAYRVVGIFETGTGYEEMGAVLTRRDAQVAAGKPRQVSLYSIELNDPGKANEVRDWLNENVSEIDVSVTAEFAENLPDMESAAAMMGGLAFLMALVGAVGMTNTILMSVMERTREIGVFRAVGWSRSRVLLMILKESLLLGALGGVSGIIIGILMTKLIALIPAVSGLFEGSFSLSIMIQAMLIAIFLGALGGIYPAWRATRMQPVEALRYE
jgi:putative ABC transport system permease protein